MKLSNLGLIANYKKEKVSLIAKKIMDWSNSKGINVCLEKAEIIISLGGDGTLLRAARVAALRGIPVFGINLGGLGFLTQIGIKDIELSLEKLYHKKYLIEERMMIECSVKRKDKEKIKKFIALNDIVVGKGAFARLVCLKTYINDYDVITYSADGLVVSTSTGSTAYSLSAGGPIVDPQIRSMLITPICPHTLSARPLIIGEDDKVRIILESINEETMLTIDGQEGFALKYKDEIVVKKSEYKTKLIIFEERNFYTILREKLKWSGQVNIN